VTRQRDELLDHDADGIREFDNDLPRWWLYGFYFTIVFAGLYLVNYHLLPTPLVGARTLVAEYEADVAAHAAEAPVPVAPGAASAEAAASAAGAAGGGEPFPGAVALTDEESLKEGQEIYESDTHPCRACHRPDLGGLVGPNLADDMWLHGCSVGAVMQSIKVGYPLLGMLPSGGGPAMDDAELLQVASYILSKRGSQPAGAKVPDPARDQVCQ
jgi:cytochrome c oxidase cbb3-type subunit 3